MKILQRNFVLEIKKRRTSFLLVCLLCFICNTSLALSAHKRVVILFTNDMHSAVDSLSKPYQREVSIEGRSVKFTGGFSRLATAIERERSLAKEEGSALLVVDAGDMAMGTLYQSLYSTDAVELTSMANMGYDALCLGNHDFDYGSDALASMLLAAKSNVGSKLPTLLSSTIFPKEGTLLDSAFTEIGVEKSTIIEREGVKIGVIGSVGEAAYELIENSDSFNYIKPEELLQHQVEYLKEQGADYIVLISHGGTLGENGNFYTSPDGLLAQEINGIDVIISGHDHHFLFEPLKVGNTYIGSSGSNLNYLGKMVIERGGLLSYELIPIDNELEVNRVMQSAIDSSRLKIDSNLYKMFGVRGADTLGVLNEQLEMVLDSTGNMKLGALIAKSYSQIIEDTLGIKDVIGVSMYGTIRGSLAKGEVTFGDVFKLLSLGGSSDGKPGSPLVLAWLRGNEVKELCEIVASISDYLMDATLFFNGVVFEYNPNKIPFTRVTDVKIYGEELDVDRLYPIATGSYTANLISLVEPLSKGLISISLKDSTSYPLKSIESAVVKGNIPEWLAFSKYLKSSVVEEKNVEFVRSRVEVDSKSIYLLYVISILLFLSLIVIIINKLKHKRNEKNYF